MPVFFARQTHIDVEILPVVIKLYVSSSSSAMSPPHFPAVPLQDSELIAKMTRIVNSHSGSRKSARFHPLARTRSLYILSEKDLKTYTRFSCLSDSPYVRQL